MIDDDNDQYGFWKDEPTRPLERITARRKPAGPAPVAPTRPRSRPIDPQAGSRQPGSRQHGDHTQQLPVVGGHVSGAVESVRRVTAPVDPLLRRIGALVVAVAVCVPVALTLRGGDDRQALQPQSSTVVSGSEFTESTAGDPGALVPASESTIDIDALPEAIPVNTTSADATVAAAGSTDSADTSSAPPSASQPVKAIEAAPQTTAACKKYEVVAGDYWILIAKKVSVTVSQLLAANGATTATALYPGRSICLPANASAPTTAAPPTTVKATTTTVKVTTTTAKVTTTTVKALPPPKKSYTRAEVEAIIRAVWPDPLEDEAVRIATRESNLQPGVRNYCCFGLFQIYYSVHKGWLAQIGITSAEQLYDPLVNAHAAYTLYQRAGGWGPWKL